jgi:tRNA (guanine-N7-)-methyltransferase
VPRKKKSRVAQLAGMPHVFVKPHESGAQTLREFALARPLVLDLGCGRGETTVALAERDPERHYLGVDLKAARLHRGAELAHRGRLANVAFAVLSILHLDKVIPDRTCHEGWLFFPDPFLKQRAVKHRLVSPAYLDVYRKLMREGARLHLKTDSRSLFDYSLRELGRAGCRIHEAVENLPAEKGGTSFRGIESTYETRYRLLGRAIHYLSFQVH